MRFECADVDNFRARYYRVPTRLMIRLARLRLSISIASMLLVEREVGPFVRLYIVRPSSAVEVSLPRAFVRAFSPTRKGERVAELCGRITLTRDK